MPIATRPAPLPGMEEVYEGMKPLLISVVKHHRRRYGGDWEELLSQARYHFVVAYHKFDPSKGSKITSWIALRVRYQLLETVRQQVFRSNRKKAHPLKEDAAAPRKVDLDLWGQQLSADARYLLQQVLAQSGAPPMRIRTWLIATLQDLGWATARIAESFAEIRQALLDD